ncbi:hypothetical protein ECE26_11215, partial [Acinetobacter baumannii]|nr:hypothetical protein [Acinetobacter baumannii]
RAIARPTRSEYLARINEENRLKHEIQQLTQALALEKQNTVTLVAQAQQQAKAKPAARQQAEKTSDSADQHTLALNIQFYDPKQLLSSVNQSVSVPYFKLCQLFLNKSIELCVKHYQLKLTDIEVVEEFNADGATLAISTSHTHAVECLLMIGTVFQLLSDVLYKR